MGALIPLAISIAPEIAKWLFGDGAAVQKTTAAVAQVVEAATGAKDGAAQADIIARDPKIAMQLRVQLAQIAAQAEADARKQDIDTLSAQLADTAGARAQTIALAQARSGIAWGAPVVSFIVLATFGIVMGMALTVSVPEQSTAIVNVLLGSLATMATSVVSYWVGSSAGSARKDEHIARLATSVPAS